VSLLQAAGSNPLRPPPLLLAPYRACYPYSPWRSYVLSMCAEQMGAEQLQLGGGEHEM